VTVAYRISIKTTVADGSERSMADSVAAVAELLDEIQQNTAEFLGFTLSSDRKARTALFSIYVDQDDPDIAVAAAHSWAVTAINAAGDVTRGWAMFAHPEGRERLPA
jgi:hypothetical protein